MPRAAHITVDVRMMHHSGVGTYIRALLPRVLASRPQYRFTLLGVPEHLRAASWARGANVRTRVCTAPIYSVQEQLALLRAIPRDTDVYWAPHYNIPLLRRPRHLMVTIHDIAHLALPEFTHAIHRRLYARSMYASVRRRADALLCDSDFTAREYTRLVGIGRATPTTVYLGVEERWFSVERRCRPHSRPFFLFIGNVKPNKNLRTLLRAVALVKDAIPHDVVIVGQREGFGTGDPGVERESAALGDRVHFTGFVEHDRLEQFVAFADALVMPSLYEGFGLPPLEAMAAGCPVVTARAASLPEVCGDAALYFDPTDAAELASQLVRLAGDAPLRQTLRERGERQARRFSWETCAARTLAALDPLAAT